MTKEEVSNLYDYRDGMLFYKVRGFKRDGKRAGSVSKEGYRTVELGRIEKNTGLFGLFIMEKYHQVLRLTTGI